MSANKICQSCAMPLSKDPENGGSEKDGSRSVKYCSLCYRDSEFLSPEIDTAQKMQKFCIDKMKECGVPRFLGWLFTRSIPKLERWR